MTGLPGQGGSSAAHEAEGEARELARDNGRNFHIHKSDYTIYNKNFKYVISESRTAQSVERLSGGKCYALHFNLFLL